MKHEKLGRRSGIAMILLAIGGLAGARAAAQAPARVGCTADENGGRAPASFRVVRASTTIATGVCGRDVDVPSGAYELVVALDGALGASEQHFAVEARAGTSARVNARFETGELLVELTRAGRRSVGLVHLLGDGKELARLSAGVATRVATGSYAIEIASRGEKRRVEGVTIARGERRVISLELEQPK